MAIPGFGARLYTAGTTATNAGPRTAEEVLCDTTDDEDEVTHVICIGFGNAVNAMGEALASGMAIIADAVEDFLNHAEPEQPADAPSAPHDPLTDDDWPATAPGRAIRRARNYRRGWARPPP